MDLLSLINQTRQRRGCVNFSLVKLDPGTCRHVLFRMIFVTTSSWYRYRSRRALVDRNKIQSVLKIPKLWIPWLCLLGTTYKENLIRTWLPLAADALIYSLLFPQPGLPCYEERSQGVGYYSARVFLTGVILVMSPYYLFRSLILHLITLLSFWLTLLLFPLFPF